MGFVFARGVLVGVFVYWKGDGVKSVCTESNILHRVVREVDRARVQGRRGAVQERSAVVSECGHLVRSVFDLWSGGRNLE